MRILGMVTLTMLATALFASVDYQDLQQSIHKGETQTQLKERIAEEGLEFALNRGLLKQMKRDHFPNWLIDHLVDYEQNRLLSNSMDRADYPRRYYRVARHDLYASHLTSSYFGWFAPSLQLLNSWCYPFYWDAWWSPWWSYQHSRYRYGYGHGFGYGFVRYGRPHRYYPDQGYRNNNRGARIGPDGYRRGQQTGRRAVPRGQAPRYRSSTSTSRSQGDTSSSRGSSSRGTAVRRR